MTLPLTQGWTAWIDAEWEGDVRRYPWYVARRGPHVYAQRQRKQGRSRTITGLTSGAQRGFLPGRRDISGFIMDDRGKAAQGGGSFCERLQTNSVSLRRRFLNGRLPMCLEGRVSL